MINEKQVELLRQQLVSSSLPNEFEIAGIKFKLKKNKSQVLQNLDFSITQSDVEVNLSIQLYLNESQHYRLFCFNPKGLLFSLNFTVARNYEKDVLKLRQNISLSNRNMAVEQKRNNELSILKLCEKEGLKGVGNTVMLGYYNISDSTFIETTSSNFLLDFIKIAIIKGHFMGNKNYTIKKFDK